MFQDLRYGVRMLLKHKSFTAVAILSVALGIGANTAIFQLLDAVRLRMLPVRAPQELAEVRMSDMKGARGGFGRSPSVTNRTWEQIREQQQAFSSISAWGTDNNVNLAPSGELRLARMLYASGDFFNTLGVQSALGRLFTTADDQWGCGEAGLVISIGGPPVVIGVAVGVPLIFAVTRLAASLLFELSPTDTVSLLSSVLLMLTVTLVAGYLPSHRATRVDPMVALRCE